MQREFYRQTLKQTVAEAVPVPLFENDFTFKKLHADNYNPSSSSIELDTYFSLVFPVGTLSIYFSLSFPLPFALLTRSQWHARRLMNNTSMQK